MVSHICNPLCACRVYVGSLNVDVDEQMLRVGFSPFGAIKTINLSWDPITNKHKGFHSLPHSLLTHSLTHSINQIPPYPAIPTPQALLSLNSSCLKLPKSPSKQWTAPCWAAAISKLSGWVMAGQLVVLTANRLRI